MACDGYTEIFDLARGEMLKLDGARGTTLRVTRGTVWITMQDDTRDVVLEAGDVFTVDRGGLTIVEAQGAATLCALARHVSATRVRPGPDVPSWIGRLAAARRWVPYF
jgi:hypothetical protein